MTHADVHLPFRTPAAAAAAKAVLTGDRRRENWVARDLRLAARSLGNLHKRFWPKRREQRAGKTGRR